MAETIKVGLCPKHGIIKGDTVAIDFPHKAECVKCGKELENAGYSEIPDKPKHIETEQGKV